MSYTFEGRTKGRSRGRGRAGRRSWRGQGLRGAAAGLDPGIPAVGLGNLEGFSYVDSTKPPPTLLKQPSRGFGVPDFSTDLDADFNSPSQTGGFHKSGGAGIESGDPSSADPHGVGPNEGSVCLPLRQVI